MYSYLVLLSILVSLPAMAEDYFLTIAQYDLLRERATISLSDQAKVPNGTILRVHGKQGSCTLKVTDRVNNQLIAKTKECGTEILKPGMRLTYTSNADADWPQEGRFLAGETETSNDYDKYSEMIKDRISFFLGYNFSSNLEGKVRADGSVRNLTGTSAFSMGLLGRVYDINPQIGISAGLGYETNRSFDEGTFVQDGATFVAPIPGNDPELTIWALYAQVDAKLMDRLSAFGGLNFSIPSIKKVPWSTSGDIGFQAGAGYEVFPKLNVEGLIKITNMNLENEIGETTDISLSGLEVRARYTF